MPCLLSATFAPAPCSPEFAESGSWGVLQSVCRAHFDALKSKLGKGQPNRYDGSYLDDYAKIGCLMRDREAMLGAWRRARR